MPAGSLLWRKVGVYRDGAAVCTPVNTGGRAVREGNLV